ncbi:uncharacterized protein TRIADDRAFT_21120, partial [Trichoplax adhaerens]
MNWIDDIPVCPSTGIGTVTNERIAPDGISSCHEHEYDDCSFRLHYGNGSYLYGVFDGHDGKRAAVFASQRFPAEILLEQRISRGISSCDVVNVLVDAFNSVERGFFESISDLLTERIELLQSLPTTMNDYEVFKKYPKKVERLQQLQELISGGAAAVIALIHEDNLYVASVGDARALLCYRTEGSDFEVQQLSIDHTVSNKDEASRLRSLGIDINRLTSSGVLGSHNNTRTIGDYYLKGGYKESDILSVSLSEPITAKPDIRGGYPINYDSWHFLVLMSSGIYKVLEAHSNITDPNIYIAKLIWSKLERGKDINDVSQQVVNEICRTHRACFNDQRSNCWYHEDMTLLVRSFGH